MLEYLPIYERKSKVFQNIIGSQEKEFALYRAAIADFRNQLSIDTATWGLEIYEKELGIKTDLSKPIEDRRSVVKSKWRGTGKVKATLIKAVVDAYTNGQVEISFDGKIHVKFTSVYGIPPNLDDAQKAVEEVAPAHLRVVYEFAYLLIKDIDGVKTLIEMEQIPLNKFAGGEI